LCAGAEHSASAQDQPVIHVALSPFEAQADAYYAQDLGLFKRAGLNIEIEQLQGGEAIVAGIVAGAVQIGAGTPVPLANAHERGLDVVLIAPGTMSDATLPQNAGLIVAANSPLRNAADFNGRLIAVNTLHSIDQIAMQAWSDRNGGDSRTLKFVELPLIAMVEATAGGRVDGAVIAEPGYSTGIDSGRVRSFANINTAVAKRFMITAWFASRAWADANPDAVRKFAASMNEAATWAVKNPAAAAAVLRKYMKVAFALAHERHANALDPGLLQPLVDAAVRYKVLPQPLDVHDVIWH